MALVAVMAPANGWAAFSPRFIVSGPLLTGCSKAGHRVAIDANGDAVFVWLQEPNSDEQSRVQARRRSGAGVFGPILNVTGVTAQFPDLAIDDSGDAVITWQFSSGTTPPQGQFRALSGAGQLGPITNLTNLLLVRTPKVAMNGQGKAVFVWERLNNAQTASFIEARERSATGTLGPIQRVSLAGQFTRAADVAVNGNGEAVLTWLHLTGSDLIVQARRRSATGQLDTLLQNLGPSNPFGIIAPRVAVAADGDAIIAWQEADRGVMRTVSTTNALGQRQRVADSVGEIAMNAAGHALFTISEPDGGGFPRARTRFRSAGGVFTATQTVSPPGGIETAAGIDNNRRGLIAWSRRDPPQGTTNRIEARVRSATGALGPVRLLSSPAPSFVAAPAVAMNGRGQAVIAWCEADEEETTRIFGATFTP